MIDAYGIHIDIAPINLHLYIHFYALILMTGMLVAAWVTARRAQAQGYDPKHVWDGLMWAIIPGLIGARIYHILTPSPAAVTASGEPLTTLYYLQHPLEMFFIWNGGLGIYGALVGGALGILAYAHRYKQPVLKWFDLVVPGLALAQAIGRWGNFVNQELYGAPTTLPWAIYIPPDKRVAPYKEYETFHPLFLYESLWNVASFGVLLLLERRFRERLRDGDLFLVYLMLYATGRFLLDFVRLDSNGFGPITTAQLVSLVTFACAGVIVFVRHRQPAAPKRAVSAEQRPSK